MCTVNIVKLLRICLLPLESKVGSYTVSEKYLAGCFSPDNPAFPKSSFRADFAIQVAPDFTCDFFQLIITFRDNFSDR